MKTSQREKYIQTYFDSLDQNLSKASIKLKKSVVNGFLDYLDLSDIDDLLSFEVNIVYDYILSLDVSSATKSLTMFILRAFFESLYKMGMTDAYGRKVFPVIYSNKRDRIPSYYNNKEIREMLSTIAQGSKASAKKRCMVLMSTQMGLRSSDIIYLKFSEIKWNKDIIEKNQGKTGILVSVPMPENIKLLLIDYIKNYRPESESEYIFLKDATGEKYASNILYTFVSRAFNNSNVEIGNRKHGAHALRHSLATRLLQNNTPIHVITGILGHKNMNTTKQYLSININELRTMSLEVSEYEDN